MRHHVVATAGHVDHGKSALVRALTGIEPDRWDEERRRGLTIDLGYAWTTLPSGVDVAFVDVPGHERFLGNMLAGIGPAPTVLFVVAADEGWRAQSSDHRDALMALGIASGVIVITRADRAPIDAAAAQAREALADTGLADAPMVAVDSLTGKGIDQLKRSLDEVLAQRSAPRTDGRIRLWIDRAFSIRGAGTVVTGTLAAGSIAVGDHLEVRGRSVVVRGLQSEGTGHPSVGPVSRVAVNLRDLAVDQVDRGDALVTPGAWPATPLVDVRRTSGPDFPTLPAEVTVHVGTAAVSARVRPFDSDHARLTLANPLPLIVGDRLVLRDPGSGAIGGAVLIDPEPPSLTRRGDAKRRAAELAEPDLAREVRRRGSVPVAHLEALGYDTSHRPEGVEQIGQRWVDAQLRARGLARLRDTLENLDPVTPGLSKAAALDLIGLGDAPELLAGAGIDYEDGWVRLGQRRDLGAAEAGIAEIERRLQAAPFVAPTAEDLATLDLGPRELAAAERVGRLIRIADGVVLLPSAPARAMRQLAGLSQPFTTSAAREALDSTRRVVVPLLELLDRRGWTRRVDENHRIVQRPARTADTI